MIYFFYAPCVQIRLFVSSEGLACGCHQGLDFRFVQRFFLD